MKAFATLLLALGVAACSSSQKPMTALSDAKAAVRSAEEIGAEDDPEAALYLRLASDELRLAETLIRKHQYSAARRSLEKASADAELAMLTARTAKKRASAREAEQKVRELRAEIMEPAPDIPKEQ